MPKVAEKKPLILPAPADFRTWLGKALIDLEVSPGRLAGDLNLGKNTVRDFLNTPGRSINLCTAANIHVWLIALAVTKGAPLRPLFGDADA